MKILVQNSIFFPRVIGGAELSSHLLGRELRRRGVAADAVATTGRHGNGRTLETRPTDDGLGTVYEAPAHGPVDLWTPDGRPPQANLAVRSLGHLAGVASPRWERLFGVVLEGSRPDVVHTNTFGGLTPSTRAAAARRGVPVVHTLRDYHLLCARTTLLRSDGSDCTAAPLPCRVLANLKLARTHGVALVTAPTDHVLQQHLQAGGFRGAATAVVPNALEEWPAAIPERTPGGPVRGLYLGQMDRHKGIPLLLQVLETVFADGTAPRLAWDFAGAGPLSAEVQAFCTRHPGRARWHGMVSGDAKRGLLAQAAFMAVPSVWREPFSRSIIDGFSWGLPALACRVGGIPEVVSDGRDGLLIEPEAGPLQAALEALANDDDRRLALGLAARARAADFTLERQVDRFIELYNGLLARGGDRDPQA